MRSHTISGAMDDEIDRSDDVSHTISGAIRLDDEIDRYDDVGRLSQQMAELNTESKRRDHDMQDVIAGLQHTIRAMEQRHHQTETAILNELKAMRKEGRNV